MIKMRNMLEKNEDFFQSVAIFPSWLLMIFAVLVSVPALLMLSAQQNYLIISIVVSVAGLFTLGFVTAKEKDWSYIGWVALTVALIYLVFSIPHGIQLSYLVLASSIMSLASYFGFTYKNALASRTSGMITGMIFLLIFIPHVVLLSNPGIIGFDVEGDEFPEFTREMVKIAVDMDPVEFSGTDEGRKIAIETYETSVLISEDDLQEVVRQNPAPLREKQQLLLSADLFANDPYGYIMSVYTYSFINNVTIEK